MQRLWLILLFVLTFALPTYAVNDHNLPTSAEEQRAWAADAHFDFALLGCRPTVPSSSLTLDAFACTAYAAEAPQQYYIDQAAATVTITDNPTVWLAVDRSTNRSVTDWTRQGLTHYIFQANASQPATPPGAILFAEATVAGSVITRVEFIANSSPVTQQGMQDCTRSPGATMGQQIQACIESLPAAGGVADARGFPTAGVIDVDMFANFGTKTARLLLGAGIFTVSTAQTWPTGVFIQGIGQLGTTLRSTTAVALWSAINTGGAGLEIFSEMSALTLDGASTGTVGIDLQKVASFHIRNVGVTGFVTAGIRNRGSLIFTIKQSKIFDNAIGIDSEQFDATTPVNILHIEDTRIIANTTYGLTFRHGAMLIIDGSDFEINGTGGNPGTGGLLVEDACVNGSGTGAIIRETWFESNKGHSAIRFNAPMFVTCLHTIVNSHSLGAGADFGVFVDGGAVTIDYVMQGSTFQTAAIFDLIDTAVRRGIVRDSIVGTASVGTATSLFPSPTGPSVTDNRSRATVHTINTPLVAITLNANAATGLTITNTDAGGTANPVYKLNNGTRIHQILGPSTGFAPNGVLIANRLGIFVDGPEGMGVAVNNTAACINEGIGQLAANYIRCLASSTILTAGLVIGAATGGSQGAGTINVDVDIFRDGAAYDSPDYVFEHYVTGKSAADYPGLMPLAEVEAYTLKHHRLPRVSQARGIFDRSNVALEKIEELYLYVFKLEAKVKALELAQKD